jgi:hypothetical protein
MLNLSSALQVVLGHPSCQQLSSHSRGGPYPAADVLRHSKSSPCMKNVIVLDFPFGIDDAEPMSPVQSMHRYCGQGCIVLAGLHQQVVKCGLLQPGCSKYLMLAKPRQRQKHLSVGDGPDTLTRVPLGSSGAAMKSGSCRDQVHTSVINDVCQGCCKTVLPDAFPGFS